MKKFGILAGVAGIALTAVLTASTAASADDSKLEQLKAQGFARVAIANEPPYTAVAADGKVSGAAPDVAREVFKRLGVNLIPVDLPDLPYDAMRIILSAEAAASFDELTRSDRDKLLVQQGKFDWPNSFRTSRFIPAVDLDLRSPRPDYAALGTQLLRWAREPGFDGLNLIVRADLATTSLFRNLVYDLRKSLRDDHRSLAVTVSEQNGELPSALGRFGNLYVIDAAASGALETAIAPISLVGAPAG